MLSMIRPQKVGLPKAENEETFAKVIAEAQLIRDNIDRESKQLGIDRDNLVIEEDQLKKKRKTAEEELQLAQTEENAEYPNPILNFAQGSLTRWN